jgi:hypothetical protein
MKFTRARQLRAARLAGVPALCLAVLSAGCASAHQAAAPGTQGAHVASAPAAQPVPSHKQVGALAAAYLAIARPANRRLDHAVDGFGDSKRHNLAAAAADLRSEAATERWFDQHLLRIGFPAAIKAVATAMVAANDRRITLTELEARSTSLTELGSFTTRHKAADAAVETEVRAIRLMLGLPPPSTS